jgi:hypothetical protein
VSVEYNLPGTEGGRGERVGGKQGGEMTQIMYVHVNKKSNEKKYITFQFAFIENFLKR